MADSSLRRIDAVCGRELKRQGTLEGSLQLSIVRKSITSSEKPHGKQQARNWDSYEK